MPGAKPQISPPTAAGARVPTSRRRSSTYQATAVPARQQTTATQNATCEPKSRVTGVSGTPRPSTEVFAIRLTPSGAFNPVLKSGFSPSTTACAAWASIHSKRIWSPAWWNSRHGRPHCPLVTSTARPR